MSQRTYIQSKVVKNLEIGPGVYHLVVDAPGDFGKGQPGQFVMVRPGQGLDPLLARPFSIHDLTAGRVELLYRVVGRGTRLMARLAPGQSLSIMGPLGRGFELTEEKTLLLAGGIGAAPFLLLAKRLHERGNSPRVLFGAKSAEELVRVDELREFSSGIVEVTEDGTAGHTGLVTDLLEQTLKESGIKTVSACGPKPMLRAAREITEKLGIPLFVSLEEVMGCGVGVCLGCAVPRPEGGYLHLCSQGPVVEASEVAW